MSEAVREELTELIGFELDDPRLLDVTVTEVHVSPDGRYAHIKVNRIDLAGAVARHDRRALRL